MKIYLAGYETALKGYGVDLKRDANLFLTYYYKTNTEQALRHLAEKKHKGLITIDSGAHSFFEIMGISVTQQTRQSMGGDLPDPHKYFAGYLDWIKTWEKKFDYFCELDVQEVVGQAKVKEWRQEFKKLGLGKKLISVHHSCNSWEDYVDLCDTAESGYIAIEGIRSKDEMLPYNKYIKYAYDKKIKIHGFAFTRSKLLNHFPFYSVDSSSWTSATRFGIINQYKNGKMNSVKSNAKHFTKHHIPAELHSRFREKASCRKKLEHCAEQYLKLQNHFTKLWEARGIKWHE